jgi:hypothetical protein
VYANNKRCITHKNLKIVSEPGPPHFVVSPKYNAPPL